MFIIDSAEKPYVGRIFDKLGINYKIEQLMAYQCITCDRLYRKKRKKCECGGPIDSFNVGDITNEKGTFLIERKKYSDLYGSIHSNRLYKQLRYMAEFYGSNCALAYEGSLKQLADENPDRAAQIYSIPATCTLYGISFLQMSNLVALAKTLEFFDRKCGNKPIMRFERKRIYGSVPEQIKLYMQPKGIGRKYATRIYNKCATIPDLVEELKNGNIKTIKGIGKATEARLKKWFL